jgi:hypothetical protein
MGLPYQCAIVLDTKEHLAPEAWTIDDGLVKASLGPLEHEQRFQRKAFKYALKDLGSVDGFLAWFRVWWVVLILEPGCSMSVVISVVVLLQRCQQ